MVRPRNIRRVQWIPKALCYRPVGVSAKNLEEVIITYDELEAIRLADSEGLYQEHAARRMNVSRQTFGRIIHSAHHKIADILSMGKALRVAGGDVYLTAEGDL